MVTGGNCPRYRRLESERTSERDGALKGDRRTGEVRTGGRPPDRDEPRQQRHSRNAAPPGRPGADRRGGAGGGTRTLGALWLQCRLHVLLAGGGAGVRGLIARVEPAALLNLT